MKMSLVVEGMRSDVVAVGDLGDDTVADVAERIADVLGRSLPGRVIELLSDVAGELSGELPEGRVEIRVAGDDVQLAYVADTVVAEHEPAPPTDPDGGELSARITLRLGESLKARVEEGAARESMSVNSYIIRTLERAAAATRPPGGGERDRSWTSYRGGNRLRGYGST
jgi:hypothetical protein